MSTIIQYCVFLRQIITDIKHSSAASTPQLCEQDITETLVEPQGILCIHRLVVLLVFFHLSVGLRMQDKNFPTLQSVKSVKFVVQI